MSRRSLRPQLNQIRGWVRQGRTDAWIAHQLEVTVQQIQAFKREQGLEPDGEDEPAPPSRRSTCAPRTTRRSPPSSRRRPRARAEEEAARGRGGRAQGRRGGRRKAAEAEAEAEEEEKPKRARPRAAAAARAGAPRRGPARGHLRPRRGGLRPVARPRRPGRPDLRRALGGPPPRRDHDRGRPDRDPPRRRRRGRRRGLTPRARDRLAARAGRAASCDVGRAVGARHRACAARRRAGRSGTPTRARRGRRPGRRAPTRSSRAADGCWADLRHRKLEVEDEAAGARLRPASRRSAGRPSGSSWLRSSGRRPRRRRRRGGPVRGDARAARSSGHARTASRAPSTSALRLADAEDGPSRAARHARARRARRDGAPVGFAMLPADGDDAPRSSRLYVTPARARARASAARCVAAALARRRARRETWIVADDEGDAQRLYERLGFETVWRPARFTRRPG